MFRRYYDAGHFYAGGAMEIIRLEQVRYAYPGEIEVFAEFCFTLRQGERVGILGSNGSGKTTLLSLIMGLCRPQAGTVILFENRMENEADFFESRKKIGYLFQDPDDQVFCPTVEEDISFGPLNLGMSQDTVQNKLITLSERLGITPLKKRITTKLSWGQKRLVSLAGILAMDPELLILDEPTASIDENVIQKITDYLRQSSHSLLVVSHDKPFLDSLCSVQYVLKDGRLEVFRTTQ